MAVNSMTGFARCDGAHTGVRWHWEVRSVNGRGLDTRLRLAPGFDALESSVREIVARRISRGSLSISLVVERETGTAEIRVNEAALAQILSIVDRLRVSGAFDPPRPEGVLALRGVLEIGEPQETEVAATARHASMLQSLERALDELGKSRAGEGARLGTILKTQLGSIARIVDTVAHAPSRAPEAIRARLAEQLQRIAGNGIALDDQRLYQEAALLATKADVEEELKRLAAHVAAASELLASPEPVGRKLDFLAQEFNREANTLCSKANDVEITRLGLELKAVIDQMREQVANIE